MSCDVIDVPEGGGARGRGLRVGLAGDFKPASEDDPAAEVLARVYALILSWPVLEPDARVEGGAG